MDGRSLVPLLQQSGSLGREALYWHYPHYWGGGMVRPFGAVRAGDWKLIEFYEDQRVELYHLTEDLGETRNLAQNQRAKAAELRGMLHRWRNSVWAPDAHAKSELSPPPTVFQARIKLRSGKLAPHGRGIVAGCVSRTHWLRMAEE